MSTIDVTDRTNRDVTADDTERAETFFQTAVQTLSEQLSRTPSRLFPSGVELFTIRFSLGDKLVAEVMIAGKDAPKVGASLEALDKLETNGSGTR